MLSIGAFFSEWGIAEWVSVVGTIVGIPLAVAGAVYARRQLSETKGAAVAAKDAVERTERHFAERQLLLLIPRMLQNARDLQHAIAMGDRAGAGACLTDWRETATQVRVLVRRTGDHPHLGHQVDRAVALIATAQDELGDPSREPTDATQRVRDRMGDVSDSASEVLAAKMTFVTQETV